MKKTDPSFSIYQLVTPNIDTYASYSVASVWRYAQKHQYAFAVQRSPLVHDMHINWSKIELLRQRLEADTADYVVLMDADLVVVNPLKPLTSLLPASENFSILMPGDTAITRRRLPNAGLVIVKNNALGKEIISQWMHSARNDGKKWADVHPRNQLVYWNCVRPRFRAHECLIPNHLATKYFWFTPWIRKERFVFHLTNTGKHQRATQMQALLLKYCPGDLHIWQEAQDMLSNSTSGLLRFH